MAIFKGVPTFFRGNCMEARAGHDVSGNLMTYANAGWHLANSTVRLVEGDNVEEVEAKLKELREHLAAENRTGVLDWYKREFPGCVALVPPRRRRALLDGIFGAFQQGRLG